MFSNVDHLEYASILDEYFDVKDQLKRHIYDRSFAMFAKGDRDRDAIQSVEQLEARQTQMRESFFDAIGGLPPMDTPLNPRICGEVACDGFKIEKVIFESRPQTYVTANVYIPDGITAPRAAVLLLCGHSQFSKGYNVYQVVYRTLVKAGLIVMAQDPVGQGERFSYWEPALNDQTVGPCTRDHDHAGLQSLPLGDSICRYFIHDAMRSIDYLMSRPEVDPNRIGVTGNSGGGTQTCLMMMSDPRIAAAAPGTFVMNRKSYMLAGTPQDQEQIWPKMTSLGFDHEDVLLMMAPKPVRVLAVKWDYFPIEATRRTVQRCKRIWEICGAPDAVDIFEDEANHGYTPTLAKAAAEFFCSALGQVPLMGRVPMLGRDLKSRPNVEDDPEIKPMEISKTWCTKSGQVRGEIEGAKFVYDDNVQRLSEFEAERAAIPDQERRERATAWLRERVLAHRQTHDPNPRFLQGNTVQELEFRIVAWWTQENVINYGILFRHFRDHVKKLPLTIGVWDGGCSCLRPHIDWIRSTCESGRAVLVLNLSGVGKLAPHQINPHPLYEFYGTIYKLSNDLYWLNDSIVAMRIYDFLRALDAIEQWPGLDTSDIRCYAGGLHSIYPRLAAILDNRITEVELAPGAFISWADWIRSRQYVQHDILSVILPGALKYFDLPDADRWKAAGSAWCRHDIMSGRECG